MKISTRKLWIFEDEITHVVDLWFKGTIEGYALEFSVEYHQSLTGSLKEFKKEPCISLIY